MYIPTPDDEVQITRKMYGIDCKFSVRKKKKLTLLDKIKKLLKITDEWIDYEYNRTFYTSDSDFELHDYNMIPSECNLETIEIKYNIKNKLWEVAKSLSKNFIKDEFTIHGVMYGKGVHRFYTYDLDETQFAGTAVFVSKNYESPDASKLIFDNLLNLPHVEILHTGEWNEDIQNSFVYDNFLETTEKKIPHAGVVVKHVSGDISKVATIWNPDFRLWIGRKSI